MPGLQLPATLALLLAGSVGMAWGQAGIYTCVDGKGRRLTSDRPIPQCLDRVQRQLNPSGTVLRVVPPTPTAVELAAQEAAERKEAEVRLRQAEEKRMQRALLMRYPNAGVHDAERTAALQTVQDAIALSERRIVDLQQQRRDLDLEAEFYPSPAAWPPKLKRQVEENGLHIAGQQRFIAGQEEEKQRIERRFAEERARLETLWKQAQPVRAAAAAAAASAPGKR
jgi:hypothetical protein